MQETWVRPLGWEDPLKEDMATHSSILARRIPWTEEPGGLQSCCFIVTMSCPTLCDPMDCSTLGFPVLHHLSEFTQTLSTESVMLSNCLTCSFSLPFLPSVFPRFRVFSSESALCTRWPKYWNFNFSISPSNQY